MMTRKRTTNNHHGVDRVASPNRLRQVAEWQEYALRELPEDTDPGTRANVCSRVEAVVVAAIRMNQQPDAIRDSVDSAISQALVPFLRRKYRQEALRHALERLSCDGHAKEGLVGPARRRIVAALAILTENAGYPELAAAANRAVDAVLAEFKTERFRAA